MPWTSLPMSMFMAKSCCGSNNVDPTSAQADGALAMTARRTSAPPLFNSSETVVLFDGTCKLCNGWAKFIIRHDRLHCIRLATVQSSQGSNCWRGPGCPLIVSTPSCSSPTTASPFARTRCPKFCRVYRRIGRGSACFDSYRGQFVTWPMPELR